MIRETRANYVRNSIALLNQIHTPKILFWFSNRKPDYHEDFSSVWGVLGQFPQLVNEATLEELRAHADIYVECVSIRGIPQVLWDATECIDGTSLEDGKLVNWYYPSPEMHEEAALALEPVCRSSQ